MFVSSASHPNLLKLLVVQGMCATQAHITQRASNQRLGGVAPLYFKVDLIWSKCLVHWLWYRVPSLSTGWDLEVLCFWRKRLKVSCWSCRFLQRRGHGRERKTIINACWSVLPHGHSSWDQLLWVSMRNAPYIPILDVNHTQPYTLFLQAWCPATNESMNSVAKMSFRALASFMTQQSTEVTISTDPVQALCAYISCSMPQSLPYVLLSENNQKEVWVPERYSRYVSLIEYTDFIHMVWLYM